MLQTLKRYGIGAALGLVTGFAFQAKAEQNTLMGVRDLYAAGAISGIRGNAGWSTSKEMAREAFEIADEMMKQRNRK